MWPFLLFIFIKQSGQTEEEVLNEIFPVFKEKQRFSEMFIKRERLFANSYLVMYILENGLQENRIGISVSKKVGNSVVRHHLTRLIRESYRLSEEHFRCGIDIVVIARTSAKGRNYHEIESALIHLGKLHKIYK